MEKDFELLFNMIADDSNFISITPYKRVKFGIEEVRWTRVLEKQTHISFPK